MKEYIERASVHSIIEQTSTFTFAWGGMHEKIDSLPAADVVEVVRCKNCFYYKPFGECNNTGSTVKPDDYCSYGARMDKEDEHERRSG